MDISDLKLEGIEKGSKEYNDLLKELQEEEDAPPPLFSDEDGDVDTSNAALFLVDGHSLKKFDFAEYNCLLDFSFDCSRICSFRLFTHPGYPGDGGLVSVEGKELEHKSFLSKIARRAITEYNRLSKYARLKLGKLMKVNYALWSGMLYYMTFSAIEEDTGKVGTYQAALRESDGKFVLGLFRDCDNGKILAILSITGAEEDLAAMKKIVTDARAEMQS